MAKGQKEAVVELVRAALGSGFVPGSTIALAVLTADQLRSIKSDIAFGIMQGTISYGKSISNQNEVKIYASSMVMNHLKKAKELNGGTKLASGSTRVNKTPVDQVSKNAIDVSILPDYMKSIVESATV